MRSWHEVSELNLPYPSSKPLVVQLDWHLRRILKTLLLRLHSRDTDLSGKGCSLGICIFISSQVPRCAANLEICCPECCHSTMATPVSSWKGDQKQWFLKCLVLRYFIFIVLSFEMFSSLVTYIKAFFLFQSIAVSNAQQSMRWKKNDVSVCCWNQRVKVFLLMICVWGEGTLTIAIDAGKKEVSPFVSQQVQVTLISPDLNMNCLSSILEGLALGIISQNPKIVDHFQFSQ